MHYKHLDWAAVELRKIVSVTPSSSWESATSTPDVEAMLLLAGSQYAMLYVFSRDIFHKYSTVIDYFVVS